MSPFLPVVLSVLAATTSAANTKPILGYNSYNDVGCSPNSTWMEATINAMSAKGLVDLGYNYFQVDCGWQGYERLPNKSITYDASVFPDGLHGLANLARSKGMKWSMYTDQGVYSCDTIQAPNPLRPGSLGFEKEDAVMFAAWGTEYVKVDNCYIEGSARNAPKNPRTDFPSRFGAMWDALTAVDIDEMLICQWGTPYINTSVTPPTYVNTTGESPAENGAGSLQGPAQWTGPFSTSYRLSDDISDGWANVMRIMNQAIHINLQPGQSGPGHVGDMDLLEVGNSGLTLAEQKSHFSIWALFKSSLMVSTDVPSMSEETVAIFGNKDLLAINQDDLGEPVKLIQRFNGDGAHDLFAGNLEGGDYAILLLDQSNSSTTLSVNFTDLGIASADVKDLWTGAIQRGATNYTAAVEAHGSVVLRLSNIKLEPASHVTYTFYEAESGTVEGGANVQECIGCSGGSKVGNLGEGSTLTISGIKTTEETSDVYFDYIDCEIGYLSDQGPNVRAANVSVNGGNAVEVQFPLTGYDWERDVLKLFKVRLSGFKAGQENSIVIAPSGLTEFAPDFDRLCVASSL